MQISDGNQRMLARFAGDLAGEVRIEQIGATVYAFASELACYRIHYKYRYGKQEKTRVGYSENLQSWYFSIEIGG